MQPCHMAQCHCHVCIMMSVNKHRLHDRLESVIVLAWSADPLVKATLVMVLSVLFVTVLSALDFMLYMWLQP